MALQSIQIFRYRLPLVKPLVWGSKQHFFREGLLIRFADEAAHVGYGEIAPLPGFSRETLEECQTQLVSLSKTMLHQSLAPTGQSNAFEQWFSGQKLASAVKFGVEMARLQLLSSQQKTPICQLLAPHLPKNLSLTMLLSGTPEEILKKAETIMLWPGLKSIKLKVGRLPVEEEIALVKALRHMNDTVQIRLDANRAWDLKTALYFGQQIASHNILYVEEPTQNPKDFLTFTEQTNIGVALDETLQSGKIPDFHQGIQALVVKPTLLGGIENVLFLGQKARAQKIPVVVSSSYESGLGLMMLAHLAMALGGDEPLGLDTCEAFQHDLLQPRFASTQGKIPADLLKFGGASIEKERLHLLWESSS